MRGLLGLVFFGGAAYLGYLFFVRQRQLLENTSLNIKGVRVDSIGWTNVKLTLILSVNNTTDLNLKVKNQKYTAYVNDKYLADIHKEKNIDLPAHGEITTDLLIQFNPLSLLGAAYNMLGTKVEQLNMKIKGSMTVGTGVVAINKVPLEWEGSLNDILKS